MTSQIIDPHFENDDLQPPENRLLKFFYNASKVISVNVVVRHVIFVAVVALVVSSAVLDVVSDSSIWRFFFLFSVMPLREGPFKDTPVMKVWVRNYQQSEVRMEPGTAVWEARTLPLCYAVPTICLWWWFKCIQRAQVQIPLQPLIRLKANDRLKLFRLDASNILGVSLA